MNRYLQVLAILALFPMNALPQRGGRPDSVQNYIRSTRPANPQLSLDLEPEHKWVYFHLSDLRMMRRTTESTVGPTSAAVKLYEGVSLRNLLPNTPVTRGFEVFKEFWAFHDRRA